MYYQSTLYMLVNTFKCLVVAWIDDNKQVLELVLISRCCNIIFQSLSKVGCLNDISMISKPNTIHLLMRGVLGSGMHLGMHFQGSRDRWVIEEWLEIQILFSSEFGSHHKFHISSCGTQMDLGPVPKVH